MGFNDSNLSVFKLPTSAVALVQRQGGETTFIGCISVERFDRLSFGEGVNLLRYYLALF